MTTSAGENAGMLEALLERCTVGLLDRHHRPGGSGFFVAENLILTTTSVLDALDGDPDGRWGDVALGPLTLAWTLPTRRHPGEPALPGLALLSISGDAAAGHPCVLLGDEPPGRELLLTGFIKGVPDRTRLSFESARAETDGVLIRASTEGFDRELNGGPLLDVGRGEVIGVGRTRLRDEDPPGLAGIGAATIRAQAPDLWAANTRFHQTDRRWEYARLATGSARAPVEAVRSTFELVRTAVAERPIIIAPDAERIDLHQIPSVRPERAPARAPSSSGTIEERGSWQASEPDLVFRWAPLRVGWSAAVLSGGPGVGQSYHLNMHAEALAADGLARLQAEEGDASPERLALGLPVPVLVDCAALGGLLPDRSPREAVISALVESFRSMADVEMTLSEAAGIEAVVRLAYMDGRLITCLDALDEAGGRERERVLSALTYLTERGNRLVVTSRPQPRLRDDTAKLTGCFRGEVVGFSPGQVYAFARAWFAHQPQRAAQFESGLKERAELRSLARVPLLAAFLCRLVSEGDDVRGLPTSAAQLYRAVVEGALSGHWLDASRRAIDPDSPPDPALRLRVITGAMGELSRPWRSRVDRFAVAELDDRLARQPGHRRAELAATARHAAWQSLLPRDRAVAPPPSPVRWELMFDGLLMHDSSEGGHPMLRFAHPVLGEYCVAAHVAGLDEQELARTIEEHRWFDPFWEQIWPLATALMSDPDVMIRLVLDAGADAWHEQLFLAARCLAGATSRVTRELQERVVAGVSDVARSELSFDRDRALDQLAALVAADVPGARESARALMADGALHRRTRMHATAMLAQAADEQGLAVGRDQVADRDLPATYRAWVINSIVLVEDAEGLARVRDALRAARRPGELRTIVAAIPVETRSGEELVAQVLRDDTTPVDIRIAAGRALIRTAAQSPAIAREVAVDPQTVWNLRAALLAELLDIGEPDLIDEAKVVLSDPNVAGQPLLSLVEALIRSGETEVLERARWMLRNEAIDWQIRRSLARAVSEIGSEGVNLLLGMVQSGLRIDLKLRPLIALIEAGSAFDIANGVVANPGAPSWIRTRLACALVEAGDRSVDRSVVEQLITTPELRNEHLVELVAATAAREWPDAANHAVHLLKEGFHSASGRPRLASMLVPTLAAAGRNASSVLTTIAVAEDISAEDRALALIGIADFDPGLAGTMAMEMLDRFAGFIRGRVVLMLAERGSIEIADELTALFAADQAAYVALYKLISSTRASRDFIEQLIAYGAQAPAPVEEDDGERIKLDDEYLKDCGLEWHSEARARELRNWIRGVIEAAVGHRLSIFLTSSEQDQFTEMSSDEERLEFMKLRTSGYGQLVRDLFRKTQQDILAGGLVPPQTRDALPLISYTASALAEWGRLIAADSHQNAAAMLAAEPVLISETAQQVLNLARSMRKEFGVEEAMLHLVLTARAHGVDAARRFLLSADERHDVWATLLADKAGNELLLAGVAGLVIEGNERDASTYFYAALGAAMAGNAMLAIDFMGRSDKTASDTQRTQGRQTIAREAQRLGWAEEVATALLETLRPVPAASGE
jgi:hypothetical protein